MDRVKRIWYLSHMGAAKVQASLHIRTVSPEPLLLAHTSNESRGTFKQKARSLAPLNGWACSVKICHDRMLEDTNSLDGAQMFLENWRKLSLNYYQIPTISVSLHGAWAAANNGQHIQFPWGKMHSFNGWFRGWLMKACTCPFNLNSISSTLDGPF